MVLYIYENSCKVTAPVTESGRTCQQNHGSLAGDPKSLQIWKYGVAYLAGDPKRKG
jgi:hypothetical protein